MGEERRRLGGPVCTSLVHAGLEADLGAAANRIAELEGEVARLTTLINTPITDNWLEGVKVEAAHQQLRWAAEHDAGKTHPDWFWLVGYLAGKCLFAAMQDDRHKAKHHTISTAAALFNWWRHIEGLPSAKMRPGIETPKGEVVT